MARPDALKVHSGSIHGANHPIKKKKMLNFLKKREQILLSFRRPIWVRLSMNLKKTEWVRCILHVIPLKVEE